ncbi:hypothetical protein [Streptomyces prasinopilosus]|uniref:hypothetical protein n=1 Tax=Streptomyces prasinopilosus TaxID=67344 RepID=UPI0006EB759E|nr:hypothetical protein [Streptomyces prasinopilosus]
MAAISLIATAISTYYGAAVARDQLKQSQEDSRKEDRLQATRVAFWTESDGRELIIANRSLDPITVNGVYFTAHGFDENGVNLYLAYDLPLYAMPPCMRYTIKAKDLRQSKTKFLPKDAWLRPWWLRFGDNSAEFWVRDNLGRIFSPGEDALPENYTEYFDGFQLNAKTYKEVVGVAQDGLDLHPAPLKDCAPPK